MNPQKYDIFFVDLNPTIGSEQQGVRPCLVVQNNEANRKLRTTVVCAFSSVIKIFPNTLIVEPSAMNGLTMKSRLDFLQIRTVDHSRFREKLGVLEEIYRAEFKERFSMSFDLDDLFA